MTDKMKEAFHAMAKYPITSADAWTASLPEDERPTAMACLEKAREQFLERRAQLLHEYGALRGASTTRKDFAMAVTNHCAVYAQTLERTLFFLLYDGKLTEVEKRLLMAMAEESC